MGRSAVVFLLNPRGTKLVPEEHYARVFHSLLLRLKHIASLTQIPKAFQQKQHGYLQHLTHPQRRRSHQRAQGGAEPQVRRGPRGRVLRKRVRRHGRAFSRSRHLEPGGLLGRHNPHQISP